MREREMHFACRTGGAILLALFAGCVSGNSGDGGRIGNVGGTTFTVQLAGDQETPPVTTTATATGVFVLSADQATLSFDVTAIGLSGPATSAHFHSAPIGVMGGVVFDVSGSIVGDAQTTTIVGTTSLSEWSLDEAATALLSGNVYFNIHTADHAAGEIRGQLIADEE